MNALIIGVNKNGVTKNAFSNWFSVLQDEVDSRINKLKDTTMLYTITSYLYLNLKLKNALDELT